MKMPNRAQLDRIERDANRGVAIAQMRLGYLCLTGNGLTRDSHKAFEWYKKAAVQGNAKAQAKLAGLYWNGEGTDKDPAAASAWLSIASANGYRQWYFRLACYLVRFSLQKPERQKAQALIMQWQKGITTETQDR
jgi:TPR repeat protein